MSTTSERIAAARCCVGDVECATTTVGDEADTPTCLRSTDGVTILQTATPVAVTLSQSKLRDFGIGLACQSRFMTTAPDYPQNG